MLKFLSASLAAFVLLVVAQLALVAHNPPAIAYSAVSPLLTIAIFAGVFLWSHGPGSARPLWPSVLSLGVKMSVLTPFIAAVSMVSASGSSVETLLGTGFLALVLAAVLALVRAVTRRRDSTRASSAQPAQALEQQTEDFFGKLA